MTLVFGINDTTFAYTTIYKYIGKVVFILENILKEEILSMLSKKCEANDILKEEVNNIQFILLNEKEMVEKAGEGECIFLVGPLCFYTQKFVDLPIGLKACYFFVEWSYRFFYIRGKTAYSACWCIQFGEYDMKMSQENALDLLKVMGLAILHDRGLVHFPIDILTKYGEVKSSLTTLSFIPYTEEDKVTIREHIRKKTKSPDGVEILFDTNEEKAFLEKAPKLTLKKAKSYLYYLLIDGVQTIQKVTHILETEEVMETNITVKYPRNRFTSVGCMYTKKTYKNLIYSKEKGGLITSSNPIHSKFKRQTKVLSQLTKV